jgi:hypothetical protein
VRRDIEQVYSGIYLDAVTSFERLIENLFIGLLVGRISHNSSKVICKVGFKSEQVARKALHSGQKYIDWLPYINTESKAAIYFDKGLPFTSIDGHLKNQLDNIYIIRNAIAHRSSHSRRKFVKKVLASLPLLKKEKTPIGFLRSNFRIRPSQTRYEDYISVISTVAIKLCN